MYVVFIGPDWEERGRMAAAYDAAAVIPAITLAALEKIIHQYAINELMGFSYLADPEISPNWEDWLIVSTLHVETMEKRASLVRVQQGGRVIQYRSANWLTAHDICDTVPVIDETVTEIYNTPDENPGDD